MKTKPETDIKTRIEKVLSEILSDKHECRVVLKFEKRTPEQDSNQRENNND